MAQPIRYFSAVSNIRHVFVAAVVIYCVDPSVGYELADHKRSREAQCFLQVQGNFVFDGKCTFTPIGKTGSFEIASSQQIEVTVKISAPGEAEITRRVVKDGVASTSSLGNARGEHGCWTNGSSFAADSTIACVWNKDAHLLLGPTPAERTEGVFWNGRADMNTDVISSSGLGGQNALIVATKSKNGAIRICRGDLDFSKSCVANLVENSPGNPSTATLHANCKTKTFTDFTGREVRALDGEYIFTNTGEKLSNYTYNDKAIVSSAYETLCPERHKQ